jgi:hypothetical protein
MNGQLLEPDFATLACPNLKRDLRAWIASGYSNERIHLRALYDPF